MFCTTRWLEDAQDEAAIGSAALSVLSGFR